MIVLMLSADIARGRASPRHRHGAGRPVCEALRAAGFRWHPDALLWTGQRDQGLSLMNTLTEQYDHLEYEAAVGREGTRRHDGFIAHLQRISVTLDVLREELSADTPNPEST